MALFVAVWVLPAGTVAAGEAHGLGAAMFGSSPFETADVRLEEGPLPADDTHTTPPSTAAPPEATTPPAGPPPPHTGVKATLKAIPGDFRHLPSMHSLAVLAGGGALALAARPFDKEVNGRVRGSSFVKTVFAPGKFIGQGATLIGTSFAVYGIGRATDNRRLSHLGMDLLRSTLEDAVIVYGIKAAVRRDRPTGECCSFPSGHASVTFAAASVLWRHLGWKAAVPTYTVASYVALSRLHDNRHYLSDVVFGSALGVVVGHTVTMHTLHGHETWAVTPMPIPGGMGVMVSFVK
jgi:membrane-associated phospholipid phosphatase